jgi:hypothetical protein
MGAVSAALFTGVTEAVTVPVWPGVSESVAGDTAMVKLGVVPLLASAPAASEVDSKWVPSPLYAAVRE